jgi:hypothetical protein
MKFRYLQIINYVFIIVENSLLMYHHYKDYTLESSQYDVIDKDSMYKKYPDEITVISVK